MAKKTFTPEIESYRHQCSANVPATREEEWMLFYSANGNCEITLDSKATFCLPARHLLFFDTPQDGNFHIKIHGTRLCHHFIFRGMAELLAMWKKQYAAQSDILNFLHGHSGGVMLVDTENENSHTTLREINNELQRTYPFCEEIVQHLMTLLMLKLARSLRAHYRATGIYYIKQVKQFITAHSDNQLSIQQISNVIGIHRSYLQMLFKKHTGHSIVEYINHVRIGKSMLLLNTTNQPIIDIALSVGFNNRQHFTRTFTKYVGCSPSDYRQMHVSSDLRGISAASERP